MIYYAQQKIMIHIVVGETLLIVHLYFRAI